MLSLHFSLADDDGKEDVTVSDYLYDLKKDYIISAASSMTENNDETMEDEEETELRYYLLNGYCMDEPYDMTVTDMETGEILQERSVSLSIELPDTITYQDLNGDGYADMRVGRPVHSSGSKAEEEGYTPPVYMLWNQKEEQEEKSKRERNDPFAPVHELPEWADPENYIKLTGDKMLEYEVQEGDSLWRISERFYGTGYKWMTIVRAEEAPKDPNYLPVTNPVGENPFHEPEDWEAFKAEVIRCSEELCPGRVSNLTFEKSHMDDGCDLYGYYFEYDTGEEIIEYVDFFKFGKDNMSEVIGVREQEPNTVLVNTVRYIAASFTDYGGEPGMGWGDGVIPNVGANQWDYPYLHNLFEAAREQFEAGDQ